MGFISDFGRRLGSAVLGSAVLGAAALGIAMTATPIWAQSHRSQSEVNCDFSNTHRDYRIRSHVELGAPITWEKSNWILDIWGHDGMIRDRSGKEVVRGELTRGTLTMSPTPKGMAMRFEPPRPVDTPGPTVYAGRNLMLHVSLDRNEAFHMDWGTETGMSVTAPEWLWQDIQNAQTMEILLRETQGDQAFAAAWARISLQELAAQIAHAKQEHLTNYELVAGSNPQGIVPTDISWDPCRSSGPDQ